MKFLFDLGGVFFDWHPTYFYKNIFSNNDDLDYFLNNICNDEWNIKQDAGRLIQDAEDDLISLHPKYENEIRMYYKNHRKMLRGTFPKSIEILETLKKKQYKCYVLSNWSSETFQGMEDDYPFLKIFDGQFSTFSFLSDLTPFLKFLLSSSLALLIFLRILKLIMRSYNS